jgi:hypothetical protein
MVVHGSVLSLYWWVWQQLPDCEEVTSFAVPSSIWRAAVRDSGTSHILFCLP